MGQNPAKFFPPPSPYGSSQASNTVNPVAPAAQNPQVPLIPNNFTDPGTTVFGSGGAGLAPRTGGGGMNDSPFNLRRPAGGPGMQVRNFR